MNQEITKTSTSVPTPPPPDRDLNAATKFLVCWIPSDPSAAAGLTRALTAIERERITDRIVRLRACLDYRDGRTVDRTINAMMLSFPSGRAGGAEADAVIGAYRFALSDMPPWAVTDAVKAFMRGQVRSANPAFPPSAAEVHDEAARLIAPIRAELVRWEQILGGQLIEEVGKYVSRERQAQIASNVEQQQADANLRTTLRGLGKSPEEIEEVMNSLRDAPARDTFRRTA